MNEIEKYRQRRDARIKKRMDEEWVTIKGTHVLIDDDGQVKGGPDSLKSLVKESGGYKRGTKKETAKGGKTNGSDGWKGKLMEMAKGGKMPSYVGGDKEQRSTVMKEINNLYDKPNVKHRFVDQGDAAWISYEDGTDITSRVSYPSGKDASAEEKGGVVKFMLHNHIKKYGNDAPTMEQGFEDEGYRKNKEGRWERK